MAVPVLIGTATLDPDVLVDSLIPDVVDGLREDLHPQFGVRAYRVYIVIRTWTGKNATEGTFTDDAAEFRPQPLVWQWTDSYRYVQAKCGIDDIGECKLTELSLQYAADQIDPQNLKRNQEAFIAIADAHGQRSPVSLWWHKSPPYVDRVKDLGWVLKLKRVQAGSWVPT